MRNIRPLRRARGIALIFAVFMIVTLAALGVYLVTVSTGQTRAVAQDELAVRAFQAARAGIDFGVFQVLRNNSCPVPVTPINFAAPGLANFRAQVTCTQVANETEGADTVRVFHIISLACNNTGGCPAASPPPSTYVERELEITVTRTP